MPIEYEWYDDQRTIVLTYWPERWTVEDVLDTDPLMISYLDLVDHPVYQIIIFSSGFIPSKVLTSLPQMANLEQFQHPNHAGNVLVGTPRVLATIADIFSKVYRRIDFADDLAQAVDIAYQRLGESK
ncbi:MAG: hypothetical protein GYB68_08525 [Chloroflexi bacterium]|nr:hypothetical protein [Chloroflexota bacterium]